MRGSKTTGIADAIRAAGAPPSRIDPLLAARQQTHGDYAACADLAQGLKQVLREGCTATLSCGQREAVDMIATKLARIHCGDPNTIDHWRDIAGYVQLVIIALERQGSN